MAELVGAFATSHATGLLSPDRWDALRREIREMYADRYGNLPPEPVEVAHGGLEEDRAALVAYDAAHHLIRERVQALKPDAILLFGNDQNEDFVDGAVPQFAIYTGGNYTVDDSLDNSSHVRPGCPELASVLTAGLLNRGFDVAQVRTFRDDRLRAHAYAQVSTALVPDRSIPIIPIYVNDVTEPLARVDRLRAFGRGCAAALVEAMPTARVVIATSGGLSHFTFGFPYSLLTVERTIGSIDIDFDRELVQALQEGRLERLGELTDQELVNSGNVEFRQAVACLSMLPDGACPEQLIYAPLYRGLVGFWAGYWPLDGQANWRGEH